MVAVPRPRARKTDGHVDRENSRLRPQVHKFREGGDKTGSEAFRVEITTDVEPAIAAPINADNVSSTPFTAHG